MSLKKENEKYRIWHIPQVPGKSFRIPVDSPEEGKKILDVLAIYDQFQYQEKIKPDFSNAQGLEVRRTFVSDWEDWESDDGDDIDHVEVIVKPGELPFIADLCRINDIKFT